MTTYQPTIATSLNEIISSIARTAMRRLERRAQKARLANDIKLLLAMDSHLLNDIGLKGFNRLAPTQQESLLRDTVWHVSRI